MKSESNLEKVLEAGHFSVTAECGPPRGADPDIVRKKAAYVRGHVDACNVTDNQTAMVRMSSLAGCMLIKEEGIEPLIQMVVRDRNQGSQTSSHLETTQMPQIGQMSLLLAPHGRYLGAEIPKGTPSAMRCETPAGPQ